jgi:hypothetical protein
LVGADELALLELGLRALQPAELSAPGNPADGDEEFGVSRALREAARYSERASELLGPRIASVVRPHQESLATMGGFEPKAVPRLVGNPAALRRDVARIITTIRRWIERPAQFRVAYQILQRSGRLGRRSGPVLFLEFSVPTPPTNDRLVTAGLQDALVGATDPAAWDFRVEYRNRRILVVGRVGPFRPRHRRAAPTLPL